MKVSNFVVQNFNAQKDSAVRSSFFTSLLFMLCVTFRKTNLHSKCEAFGFFLRRVCMKDKSTDSEARRPGS